MPAGTGKLVLSSQSGFSSSSGSSAGLPERKQILMSAAISVSSFLCLRCLINSVQCQRWPLLVSERELVERDLFVTPRKKNKQTL